MLDIKDVSNKIMDMINVDILRESPWDLGRMTKMLSLHG